MKIFFMSPFRALSAVLRASWFKLRGYEVLATPKVVELRTLACEGCTFFDPDERQCLKCGCLTDAKVMLNLEKCPLDTWPRVWIKKSLAKPE